MTKDEFIFNLKRRGCLYEDGKTYYEENELIECFEDVGAFNPPSVRPQEPKTGHWVPVTTRPMTEEEKERHREQLEYADDVVIFNCPLPDDGQEVLITAYGETELDTFYRDAIDGCYFENRNIEDVRAWMPLPKPYKPQESEDKE